MALRRAVARVGPRLLAGAEPSLAFGVSSLNHQMLSVPSSSFDMKNQMSWGLDFQTFATSAVNTSKTSMAEKDSVCNEISMAPTHKITYDEQHHARLPAGSGDGPPYAYFVLAGKRFLTLTIARTILVGLLMTMSPSAATLAVATVEVDISNLNEGEMMTVKWRGKPVFVKHRTDEEIAKEVNTPMSMLVDPQEDVDRAVDPKYLIVVGICTHLGCVPIAGAGDYHGWFCPCHGSHYDGSGRIRKGPAPYNLEVPQYRFAEGNKLILG
jgi:ubiquinol-cytochrome c reductase iron-sulfur subunit